jgi:putative hydrolase of the HAD superfamily
MIFFDIDGTLIDHVSASAAASLRLFDHFSGAIPLPREQFPVLWEEILNKHFQRFCRGELSLWEQRRARMREAFAAPELSDEEADARYGVFIHEYESRTRAYDDAAPCLEALCQRERLGIISNGARDQQKRKLERAGLLKYFSVMVFSEDVGRGKPHNSIFFEACKRAGVEAAQCMHVGDDVMADIAGSHQAGITPVWLDRLGGSPCEMPIETIATLDQLDEVLTRKGTYAE